MLYCQLYIKTFRKKTVISLLPGKVVGVKLLFQGFQGFAADGDLEGPGRVEVAQEEALAGEVDSEDVAAVDDVAFADAEEGGSVVVEAFVDELLDVEETRQQGDFDTVDEDHVAVVGVRFDIRDAVEFDLYHLVARIEV